MHRRNDFQVIDCLRFASFCAYEYIMTEDWIQVHDAREIVRGLHNLQSSIADMQRTIASLRTEVLELKEARTVCKDCRDIRTAYSKVRRGEIFPFYKPLSRPEQPTALQSTAHTTTHTTAQPICSNSANK